MMKSGLIFNGYPTDFFQNQFIFRCNDLVRDAKGAVRKYNVFSSLSVSVSARLMSKLILRIGANMCKQNPHAKAQRFMLLPAGDCFS